MRDLVREPDRVAIDADERRCAVGQFDPRQLGHAKAADEELRHHSSI
jgi:hypothetical protein